MISIVLNKYLILSYLLGWCIGDTVVEFPPATRETRVHFLANSKNNVFNYNYKSLNSPSLRSMTHIYHASAEFSLHRSSSRLDTLTFYFARMI